MEVVVVPKAIGDLKVTYINDRCFKDKENVKEIIIPNTVRALGKKIFDGCKNLKKITIGSNVEELTSCTFENCSVEEIVICRGGGVRQISYNAFKGCKKLKRITIPDSVTFIADDAFKGIKNIKFFVYQKSYAKKFANRNNIDFEIIEG